MKKKDRQELQTKEDSELLTMLLSAKQKLLTLQLEKTQHRLRNTRSLFLQRKDIARMQTILSERKKKNG